MAKLSLFTLSPMMLLILFTSVNILVFIDRGALAAVVGQLKKNSHSGLGLSSFEAGSLGSVFILGYMIASPIFAYYSQTVHPQYLMSLGLTIWSGAVLFTGVSRNFYMLALARAITGVGEASFVCLAPPCILDCAPPEKKTKWIGIFYSATPLGYALGFVYGAQVSAGFGAWFYPFIIETFLMIPFILASFLSYKDPKFYAKKDQNAATEKITAQIYRLLTNPLYIFLVLGYTSYSFTLGGLGFWGPDFVESYYKLSSSVSTYTLGVITVFCGIIGTGSGSALLNGLMKKFETLFEKEGITAQKLEFYRVEKACRILPVCILIGSLLATFGTFLSAFIGRPGDYITFFIGLTLGEFFIFLTISPTAMAIMTCVPQELRGQANAVSVFFMHALGDFPSPAVIGAWFDTVGEYIGMMLATGWLVIAFAFWLVAWNISRFHGAPWHQIRKNFCKRRENILVDNARLNFSEESIKAQKY